MSVQTYIYRFIVANFLTLYYNVCVLLMFAFNYMKNPFGDPFALKLRLEPPPCLTDPKYGTHKYIKVNNIKLHYVESGDPSKPLMIFVHGFPEFWYSWRHQILEFQKDYWCIAIDMRGYGDSERPDDVSSYKLDLLVNDIRELVSQLGK
ncbi:epoxide hydrolase 4-like [Hyposmocoma kahamanoa]|uniref:epoxide hydrolase 4-like n=1 Tax=Hyposmocoma kahamanoa TaxID=1477025 RepID=UPI000E6D9EFE|nr:epoxide hydrolase 4-like [Hyposmocoma kahamanoa]